MRRGLMLLLRFTTSPFRKTERRSRSAPSARNTEDLFELARWLKECAVDTVAVESTGVYWVPRIWPSAPSAMTAP